MARPMDTSSARIFKDSARGERLQRFLADSGVASRRACEDLIREGRVIVNGIKVANDMVQCGIVDAIHRAINQ